MRGYVVFRSFPHEMYEPNSQRYTSKKRFYLEKRFFKFCQKYVGYRSGFRYNSWNGASVAGIYAYVENGQLYEFFSGYCIGTVNVNENGRIARITTPHIAKARELMSATSFYSMLTASQFASDVEPYMRHKEKIGSIMQEYFDILHQIHLAEQEEWLQAQEKSHARDSHNASWLESYLDGR